MSEAKIKISEIINALSEAEKKVFIRVLKAEKEKIHLSYASGIQKEIGDIIREEIK